MHLDIISFIYSPNDELVSCLKRTILKFTLKFAFKQLRHVSMQLHHHQGVVNTVVVWLHIQDVSRLVNITTGGDFPGLCNQKRSYKHVSDFGRLRSYGHFLIPVHALV